MKRLTKLGLAGALALVAASGVAGTASATTISPTSTAFTLSSTNSALALSGGGSVTCSSSTISGTTPASGSATWLSISATLAYSGCSAFGFSASVTPVAACHTTAKPILHFMSTSFSQAVLEVTLPSACRIDVSVPILGCTLTVTGGQAIGNVTSGVGGILWTDSTTKSGAALTAAAVSSIHSNGVGTGCSAAGTHTGTLSGNYAITSATNVTVFP
jgi:hypothetical protein